MNAARDVRFYKPEPYTGRAKPPESVSADNDAKRKQGPVLTFLGSVAETGNLSLVTPVPIDWLPAWAVESIDLAERAHMAGNVKDARVMVATIERRLRVTDEMRYQAANANDDGERCMGNIVGALARSFPRPKRLPAYARPKAKAAKPSPNNDNDPFAELVTLHALRGDTVIVEEIDSTDRNEGSKALKAGKVLRPRIATRDALLAMGQPTKKDGKLISPVLSRAQVSVGLIVREDYEMIDPGATVRVQDLSRSSSGAPSFERQVALEMRARRARDRIVSLERLIQSKDPTWNGPLTRDAVHSHGRAVAALRWVVGAGASIRSLSGGGKAQEAYQAALVMALDTAVEWARLQ